MRKESSFQESSDTVKLAVINLGFNRDYQDIWNLQKRIVALKNDKRITEDILLLLEHNSVFTIGRSGGENHILIDKKTLYENGIMVYNVDRGGDITYHGKGQVVGYPILDLNNFKKDVHWYLRKLEEVIIDSLKKIGLEANIKKGLTGVWIKDEKIASIGIGVCKWITYHGIAVNLSPDLKYFDMILPCGIDGVKITSLKKLNISCSMKKYCDLITESFTKIFNITYEIKDEKWLQKILQ